MNSQERQELRVSRNQSYDRKAKIISDRFNDEDEEAAELRIRIKGRNLCVKN